MTVNTVILGFGAVLLLVGILGGGFEIKEFKVPKVGPAPRVLSTIAGAFFVILAVGLQASDVSARGGVDKTTYVQPASSVQSTPNVQPSPVEFTIYDRLTEGGVTEQVTVLIDGRVKGQFTVDRQNPESMLAVTVPASGRYSYTVESKTLMPREGGLYEYDGAGQGMINVVDGKRFDLAVTFSGSTWLLTLMDGSAHTAANQQ